MITYFEYSHMLNSYSVGWRIGRYNNIGLRFVCILENEIRCLVLLNIVIIISWCLVSIYSNDIFSWQRNRIIVDFKIPWDKAYYRRKPISSGQIRYKRKREYFSRWTRKNLTRDKKKMFYYTARDQSDANLYIYVCKTTRGFTGGRVKKK